MLSTKRALCSGCRSDLLVLFQRGFCGPAVPRSRPLRLRGRRWQEQRRHFHVYKGLSQDDRPQTTASDNGYQPPEPFLSEDELKAQFAELQHLEEYADEDGPEDPRPRKGTAVEDVVITDEDIVHNEEVIEAPNFHGQDYRLQELQDLREDDADTSEVAGRARELFGDRLPLEALQSDELVVYRRLFGDPLLPEHPSDEVTLIDEDGEEVEYDSLRDHLGFSEEENEASLDRQDYSDSVLAHEQLEHDAVAEEVDGIEGIADRAATHADEDHTLRQHPITSLGKWQTSPKTVSMPVEQYVHPLGNLMTGHSNKQLKDVCERAFGGPGLPDSPLTPRSGRQRAQVPVQLEASQHFMGEMMATGFLATVMPPAYAAVTAALVDARKRLGPTWLNNLLSKEGGPRILDAGAGGAAILAWNEIIQAHWDSLHTSETEPNPPPASKPVVLVGSDPLRHRAASLLDNTTFIPRLPDYSTTRSKPTIDDDRSAQPRKSFDVIFSSYSLLPFKEEWERKQYISNLWSLLSPNGGVLIMIEKGMPRGFEAIASARELLLERFIAIPPGQETKFSAIHKQNAQDGAPWEPVPGMIVGPCSNHEGCPMYKIEGVSIGRKDICSFQQRYIRPLHLQRLLGATSRNHDDVDFSYLSVMRGRDLRRSEFSEWSHIADPSSAPTHSPNSYVSNPSTESNTQAFLDRIGSGLDHAAPADADSSSTASNVTFPTTLTPTHLLPRLTFPPLKRTSHIILDLCTPLGTLERWTVPRSFGKQAYRDARKAAWGDLWGLGAKTRIPRNIRQGSGKDKVSNILDGHMKGKAGSREEKLHNARTKMRELEALEREQEQAQEEETEAIENHLNEWSARRSSRKVNSTNLDPEINEATLDDALARARSSPNSTLYPPVPAHIKRILQDQDQDQSSSSLNEEADLDAEITAKMHAWSTELADNRPIDKQGRPVRVSAMRQKKIAETRERMDEQEREAFWGGIEEQEAERSAHVSAAPVGGRGRGAFNGGFGKSGGGGDISSNTQKKERKVSRVVQEGSKRRPSSAKPVRRAVR